MEARGRHRDKAGRFMRPDSPVFVDLERVQSGTVYLAEPFRCLEPHRLRVTQENRETATPLAGV